MATVASIVVSLTASTSRFEKALGGAQRMTERFVKQTKAITRDLDEIARYGRKAGLALAAMGGALAGVTKAAANHEENMLRVKAVTRATVAEYHAMSKAAIDLSTKTVHSLDQIGESMKFLGMAGYNTNQILSMTPVVARLATVGAMDMSKAADIASGIVAGYGLEVEQLAWATDILASAMTGSKSDLEGLGEAFKYVGPVASSAGMEFETTAAAIALLHNANITGSLAGTAFKNAITRLLSPSQNAQRILKRLGITTKDSSGRLRDFSDIVGDLAKSGATTANIMTIFGQRAGPAMAKLIDQGADSLDAFIIRLKQAGGLAEQIESEQMHSFNAQFKLMKGQIKALAVEIGDKLLPYMKTANYYINDTVEYLRNLDDETKQNVVRMVSLSAAVLGIIAVFGLVAGALSVIIKGFTIFGIFLGFVTSPLMITLALITLGVGLMTKAWNANLGGIQEKTKSVTNKIKEYWANFLGWWNGTPAEKSGFTSGFEVDQGGFKHKLQAVGFAIYDSLLGAWDWIINTTWEQKWEDIKAILVEAWDWIKQTSGSVWDGFVNLGPVKASIEKVKEWYYAFYTWWNGTPAELNGFTSGFEVDQGGFKHLLLGVAWDIRDAFMGAWDWIVDTTWGEKWEDVKAILSDAWGWIKETGADIWDGFLSLGPIKASIDTFKGYMASLRTWWEGTPDEKGGLTSGFDQYDGGFKHKLLEMKRGITEAVSDAAMWLPNQLDMTGEETLATLGFVTVASVATWKISSAVFPGLSTAITAGITSLGAGGLALGTVAVASLTLALLAGAIGWAFGDKKGRNAFVEAVRESIVSMTFDDPITIPLGISDILRVTFDFGTSGMEKLRLKIQGMHDELKAWEPDMGSPEWVTSLGNLMISMSDFMVEGFWAAFDFGEMMITAIDKTIGALWEYLKDIGRKIANAIWGGFGDSGVDAPEMVMNYADFDEFKKAHPGSADQLFKEYEKQLGFFQRYLPWLVPVPGYEDPGGLREYGNKWLEEEKAKRLEAMFASASITQPFPVGGKEFVSAVVDALAGYNLGGVEPTWLASMFALETTFGKDLKGDFNYANIITGIDENGKILGYRAYENFTEFMDDLISTLQRNFGDAWNAANWEQFVAGLMNGRIGAFAGTDKTYDQKLTTMLNQINGYSSGTPWTGSGPLDEVAGIVHKQEAVIPWNVLKKGGLAVLDFLGMKGFKTGKKVNIPGFGEAQNTIADMQSLFDGLGRTLLIGINKMFELLMTAIEALAVVFAGKEGLEQIKTVFDKFKSGLEDFTKSLSTTTKAVKDQKDAVVGVTSRFKELGEQVLNMFVDGVLSGMSQLNNSVDAFKTVYRQTSDVSAETGEVIAGTGDPLMAAVAAIMSLAMSSETFRSALNALSAPIAVAAEVLGALLVPVLKMLFPIVKFLGIVLITVAQMVATVWNTLLDLISMLPFVNLRKYKINMDELSDSKQNLKDMTWETAQSMGKMNDSVNEALKNVPSGLKILTNRMQAAGYASMPHASVSGVSAVGGGGSTNNEPTIVVKIEGDVYGIEDLDRKIERGIAKAQRSVSLASYGV